MRCGEHADSHLPRGRARWYLLQVPRGRGATLCAELCQLVPSPLLEDAFVPRKERWMKRGGVWFLRSVDMHPGYALAVSSDPAGLAKAFSELTLPVSPVGAEGSSWKPLPDGAAAWLSAASDRRHVVRSSTAVITGGELRVVTGPLVGHEGRIRRIDRHRRLCEVSVDDADGSFSEQLAIEVPVKG